MRSLRPVLYETSRTCSIHSTLLNFAIQWDSHLGKQFGLKSRGSNSFHQKIEWRFSSGFKPFVKHDYVEGQKSTTRADLPLTEFQRLVHKMSCKASLSFSHRAIHCLNVASTDFCWNIAMLLNSEDCIIESCRFVFADSFWISFLYLLNYKNGDTYRFENMLKSCTDITYLYHNLTIGRSNLSYAEIYLRDVCDANAKTTNVEARVNMRRIVNGYTFLPRIVNCYTFLPRIVNGYTFLFSLKTYMLINLYIYIYLEL